MLIGEKKLSGGNLLPTLIRGGIAHEEEKLLYVLSGNKQ
jgi:hypothetical protein